jgi:hypothetical protein
MHLKIFLLFLFIVSTTAMYLAGGAYPGTAAYEHEQVSEYFIPIILFIILVTSVIGFALAMLANEDKTASESTAQPVNGTDLSALPETSVSKPDSCVSSDMLVFLRLLQEEGRLIDFLNEDISTYDDAQVASASRVVHRGCSAILKKYLSIAPVLDSNENEIISLPQDLNEENIKLHGKKSEKLKVVHKGWLLISSNLPEIVSHSSSKEVLIVPAEGESV